LRGFFGYGIGVKVKSGGDDKRSDDLIVNRYGMEG
jgi:hypothetical protein